MSDAETKNKVRDVLFGACPLRTVLTKKPCPYFGYSSTCRDCTYDWLTIAAAVRKVVDNRRAAYELEHEKNKKVVKELKFLKNIVAELSRGAAAIKSVIEYTSKSEEVHDESTKSKIEKGKDVG